MALTLSGCSYLGRDALAISKTATGELTIHTSLCGDDRIEEIRLVKRPPDDADDAPYERVATLQFWRPVGAGVTLEPHRADPRWLTPWSVRTADLDPEGDYYIVGVGDGFNTQPLNFTVDDFATLGPSWWLAPGANTFGLNYALRDPEDIQSDACEER